MIIKTKDEFSNLLKNGGFAFPGGYPLYFITDDGECLSFSSAIKNEDRICDAIENDDRNGWRVVACDVNWENLLYCCDCGKRIESAYCEDEFKNL
jgi:hypothetical protein